MDDFWEIWSDLTIPRRPVMIFERRQQSNPFPFVSSLEVLARQEISRAPLMCRESWNQLLLKNLQAALKGLANAWLRKPGDAPRHRVLPEPER